MKKLNDWLDDWIPFRRWWVLAYCIFHIIFLIKIAHLFF